MGLFMLLAQARGPTSAWDMVFGGSLPTRLVLLLLAVSSAASWILIFWKVKQFRTVRQQGNRFLQQMERATGLEDAYTAIIALPESPYGRVFRQGVNFFSELRPGALREGAPVGESVTGSSQRTVHFTGDLLRQHHLYVAKTRMGKSTLMQHVVAHKLKAKAMGQDDDAIIVVDPHSDLVRSLLNLDSLVKTRFEEVPAL